jgi:hypothetical protein
MNYCLVFHYNWYSTCFDKVILEKAYDLNLKWRSLPNVFARKQSITNAESMNILIRMIILI